MHPIVHPSTGILSSNPLADTWLRRGASAGGCPTPSCDRSATAADVRKHNERLSVRTRKATRRADTARAPKVAGAQQSAMQTGLHPSVPAMRTSHSRRAPRAPRDERFASSRTTGAPRAPRTPRRQAHPLLQAIPQEPPLL